MNNALVIWCAFEGGYQRTSLDLVVPGTMIRSPAWVELRQSPRLAIP